MTGGGRPRFPLWMSGGAAGPAAAGKPAVGPRGRQGLGGPRAGGGAASASGSWLGPGGASLQLLQPPSPRCRKEVGAGRGAARRSVPGGGRARSSLLQDGGPGSPYLTGEDPAPRYLVGHGTDPRCLSRGLVPRYIGCGWSGGTEVSSAPQLGPWGPSLLSHPRPTLLRVLLPRPAFGALSRRDLCGAPRVVATQRQLLCCLAELWGSLRAPGAPQPARLGALTAAAGSEQPHEAAGAGRGVGPAAGAPSAAPFLWLRGAGTDLFL